MLDHTVKVKICGITNAEDALLAAELGADMLGFNFYSASTRYLPPQRAAGIAAGIPASVLRVGVFVNSTIDEVTDITNAVGLDVIQLHGDEDDNYLRVVSHETQKPVVKAFRIRSDISVEPILQSDADAVLLDGAPNLEYGGTGKTFDWKLIDGVAGTKQLFLAGGLTPENVAEAVRIVRPYAVDVASGVELKPGVKDPQKVKAFIENAKTA